MRAQTFLSLQAIQQEKNGQGMTFCAHLCLYSNTPVPSLTMFNWGFPPPSPPCEGKQLSEITWVTPQSGHLKIRNLNLRKAYSWNYWKAQKQERCPPNASITNITWQADIKPNSGSVVQALLSGMSADTEEKLKQSHTIHPHALPTGSHFPQLMCWLRQALQVCGKTGISPGLTWTVRWGEMPCMTLYRAMLHCKHSLFLTRMLKAMLLACIAEMHAHGH